MAGIDFVDSSCHEEVLLPLDFGCMVHVLVWVGGLVFQDLDELVETCGYNGAEHGSKPVDPVVVVEAGIDDCGSERPDRVETTASEVNSSQFGDEKRKADSCDERSV